MKNEIYKYWKHIKIKSAIPNEMILSYDAQIDTEGVEGEFSYLNAISDNYAINNTIENKILYCSSVSCRCLSFFPSINQPRSIS